MFGFIAVIFHGLLMFFGMLLKAVLFLLKRFDVTNSLLVGAGTVVATLQIELHPGIRVGIFVFISAVSMILQHFFKPARIVFGAVSAFLAGLIAYGVSRDTGYMFPFVPMVIAMISVGLLNFISWLSISSRYQRD